MYMLEQGRRADLSAQDRDAEEGDEQWSLSRFAPLMQEVLEDLASNKLNMDEYPYVQPPTDDAGMLTCAPEALFLHCSVELSLMTACQ